MDRCGCLHSSIYSFIHPFILSFIHSIMHSRSFSPGGQADSLCPDLSVCLSVCLFACLSFDRALPLFAGCWSAVEERGEQKHKETSGHTKTLLLSSRSTKTQRDEEKSTRLLSGPVARRRKVYETVAALLQSADAFLHVHSATDTGVKKDYTQLASSKLRGL